MEASFCCSHPGYGLGSDLYSESEILQLYEFHNLEECSQVLQLSITLQSGELCLLVCYGYPVKTLGKRHLINQ